MLSQNENKNLAFERDDAVQLIIAAVQSGAIKLPFSAAFHAEKLDKLLKQELNRSLGGYLPADYLRSMEGKYLACEYADIARKDALYLLTLLQTLVVGITKEEAEKINRVALCN